MQLFGFVLLGAGGLALHFSGFPVNTWQYWAISVPLIVGAVIAAGGK